MQRILVTGSTGYIGGRLISRLIDKGYSVRALARTPENLRDKDWTGVDMVKGDVTDLDSLKASLKDIDVAYYLVHSMAGGEKGFEERDRLGALNFAKAARDAKVSRIIYLGGLGVTEQHLSKHLRSRQEVGQILASTGIPVTEFRAAIIIGSGSISFEMIRYLSERLPVMITPSWVNSLCQPIGIRDVLTYLVEALEKPRSAGQIIEIGGATVLTYKEMLLGYAKARGLKRYIIALPILSPRLSSYWIDTVTPIPASIARPLIDGLKNDVVVTDTKAAELFDIKPMGYMEAVTLALKRMMENSVETIWYASKSAFHLNKPAEEFMDTREGIVIEERQYKVNAPAYRVFKVISRIGGSNGWYCANWAWRFRAFLDRMIGGIGFRRGRRNPIMLMKGDVVDFWRVDEVIENRLLRLHAEMKMPGEAWLQFELVPEGNDRCSLIQTAFFEPKGLLGHLYWYALLPIHKLLFSGLHREIKKLAEPK